MADQPYMEWKSWNEDAYLRALNAWSNLNRASIEEFDTADRREFLRLHENLDAYELWWNQHDYPPPSESLARRWPRILVANGVHTKGTYAALSRRMFAKGQAQKRDAGLDVSLV